MKTIRHENHRRNITPQRAVTFAFALVCMALAGVLIAHLFLPESRRTAWHLFQISVISETLIGSIFSKYSAFY